MVEALGATAAAAAPPKPRAAQVAVTVAVAIAPVTAAQAPGAVAAPVAAAGGVNVFRRENARWRKKSASTRNFLRLCMMLCRRPLVEGVRF